MKNRKESWMEPSYFSFKQRSYLKLLLVGDVFLSVILLPRLVGNEISSSLSTVALVPFMLNRPIPGYFIRHSLPTFDVMVMLVIRLLCHSASTSKAPRAHRPQNAPSRHSP